MSSKQAHGASTMSTFILAAQLASLHVTSTPGRLMWVAVRNCGEGRYVCLCCKTSISAAAAGWHESRRLRRPKTINNAGATLCINPGHIGLHCKGAATRPPILIVSSERITVPLRARPHSPFDLQTLRLTLSPYDTCLCACTVDESRSMRTRFRLTSLAIPSTEAPTELCIAKNIVFWSNRPIHHPAGSKMVTIKIWYFHLMCRISKAVSENCPPVGRLVQR